MVLRNNYQARLCACGNELKGQIADIYSLTIGALTYSIVHQIAIIDRMHVRIIDTVEAYLYQTYPSWKIGRYLLMLCIVSRSIFMVFLIPAVLTTLLTLLY